MIRKRNILSVVATLLVGCASSSGDVVDRPSDDTARPEILDPHHCENRWDACVASIPPDSVTAPYWACECKNEYCACSGRCKAQLCLVQW
jgi:hypothetical protein